MKKSKVAIGIIVILGIAYVGASWYTGNVIESNIEPKVAQLTQEINDYQDKVNVAINYSDYQKGIFSTKVHLTVTLTPKSGSELNPETVTIFNDDITIHHGPFPLAALANGKFAPQMAWAEYQMTEQVSPELWKLAGNKPLITAYLGMSYQEYLTLKIANKAFNSSESGLGLPNCPKPSVQSIEGNDVSSNCKLDMSAGDVSFESDKNFTNLLVSANLDKFAYSKNKNGSLTFNKFNLSAQSNSDKTGVSYQFNLGDFTVEKQDLYSTLRMTMNNMNSQGNFIYPNENTDNQITIEKITFLPDVSGKRNNYPILINQLTFNQTNKVNQNNTSNGLLNASVGSLWVDQQNLGYGSFDLDYQGISEQFLPNKLQSFAPTDKTENDDEQLNVKMSLNKFNWHNDAGDININASIDLSGNREELRDMDIDNIDMLKFSIDAPFNVLARLDAQVENPSSNTVTDEQIAKANQTLRMVSRMFLRNIPAITFGKDNVEGIYSNVDYAKDRDDVEVNGKTMSKEEFLDDF